MLCGISIGLSARLLYVDDSLANINISSKVNMEKAHNLAWWERHSYCLYDLSIIAGGFLQ